MVAIACQSHYIETELRVPLAPVPDPDDGERMDAMDARGGAVCIHCGLYGHAKPQCPDRELPY